MDHDLNLLILQLGTKSALRCKLGKHYLLIEIPTSYVILDEN
jgi:hypothetical protein